TFITARGVNPAASAAQRAATPSNQPQRRGRRVVAPNSWPMLRIRSPVASTSSVGIGPEPTAVVYAFATPSTRVILYGGMPAPALAPPGRVVDEVTNGYNPQSRSRMTPS